MNFLKRLMNSSSTNSIKKVSFEEVLKMVEENKMEEYLIIDVRNKDEVACTTLIPYSVNIPLPLLNPEKLEGERDKLLIFSCKSGVRAYNAALKMKEHGFPSIAYYPGSFSEWSSKYCK